MRYLLILASLCNPAWAWDATGHQLVASVAFQTLTPKAKASLLALLQQHPKYSCWTLGIKATDKDHLLEVAMREAATWPDGIKALAPQTGSFSLPLPDCYTEADRTGPNQYKSDGDRYGTDAQSVANAKQNTGYADHFMHKYWHFDDLPIAATTAIQNAHPPQDINAVERIALFIKTLSGADQSPQALQLKSYDAVWLIHIVGDVHQPLHCASRYQSLSDSGDSGGNSVKITDHTQELHGFWDHLPDHMLINKLPQPVPAKVSVADPTKWAQDSRALAQQFAYVDPVGPGLGPFNLSTKPQYATNALATASSQVALAGARLAALFNSVFK